MEQTLLAKILDYGWMAVAALLALLWGTNRAEHMRHREIQKTLFDKLNSHEKLDVEMFKEVTQKMTDGFSAVTQKLHENHIEMLKVLPKRRGD